MPGRYAITTVTAKKLYAMAQERGLPRDHGLVSYLDREFHAVRGLHPIVLVGGVKHPQRAPGSLGSHHTNYRLLTFAVPLTRKGMVRKATVAVHEHDMKWLRTHVTRLHGKEGA